MSKFRKTDIGIMGMLARCKPRKGAKLNLDNLLRELYAIKRKRGNQKTIEITFPSREAAIRFMTVCKEMANTRER